MLSLRYFQGVMEGYQAVEYPKVRVCCNCMQGKNLRVRRLRWEGQAQFYRSVQSRDQRVDSP